MRRLATKVFAVGKVELGHGEGFRLEMRRAPPKPVMNQVLMPSTCPLPDGRSAPGAGRESSMLEFQADLEGFGVPLFGLMSNPGPWGLFLGRPRGLRWGTEVPDWLIGACLC